MESRSRRAPLSAAQSAGQREAASPAARPFASSPRRSQPRTARALPRRCPLRACTCARRCHPSHSYPSPRPACAVRRGRCRCDRRRPSSPRPGRKSRAQSRHSPPACSEQLRSRRAAVSVNWRGRSDRATARNTACSAPRPDLRKSSTRAALRRDRRGSGERCPARNEACR